MSIEICSDKQFVFIIGAPRSGSSWLQNILGSHPEIASANAELTVFSNYINYFVKSYEAEHNAIRDDKWKVGLPVLWSREQFDERIRWFINEIYSSLNITAKHKVILDKRPEYSFHTDLINYYLPGAKFINIIRDGREVAYSWNRVFKKHGFGNPDFAGACMDWIKYKEGARKAKYYPGNNYLEIKYEALMQNLAGELPGILDFCKLNNSPDVLASLISQYSGEKAMVSAPDKSVSYDDRIKGVKLWETRLTDEEKYTAKKLLGEELIKEGYEENMNWGLDKGKETFIRAKRFIKYHIPH